MVTPNPSTAENDYKPLPFEMGYLPEFFQKKAEIELNDTPEMRKKCLYEIKEMIKNDKSLENITFDDAFLKLFLLTRKYNVLRAFTQVKAYAHFRRRYREIFINHSFEILSFVTKSKMITFLPWRCQDGCAIILIQLSKWDPAIFSVEYVKKFYVELFTQALLDPMTQVNGFKVIMDLNMNPFKHLRACSPHNMYMLYTGTQDCLPGRFKEIHCVNTTAAGRTVWFIFKRFISEKFRNRVFFHPSNDALFVSFPRAIIPEELGGDLKQYDSTEWLRKVMKPGNLRMWDVARTNCEDEKH